MGKQLYFVHTEEDIYQLLAQIEDLQGKIISNGVSYEPLKIHDQIISAMIAPSPQYSVVIVPKSFIAKYGATAHIARGTAIELLNCWKWSTESHIYYDKGRIFLPKTSAGAYDGETLALYQMMCSYFKTHYHLHRKPDLYVSLNFRNQYLINKVHLSQLGQPYPLRLFESNNTF